MVWRETLQIIAAAPPSASLPATTRLRRMLPRRLRRALRAQPKSLASSLFLRPSPRDVESNDLASARLRNRGIELVLKEGATSPGRSCNPRITVATRRSEPYNRQASGRQLPTSVPRAAGRSRSRLVSAVLALPVNKFSERRRRCRWLPMAESHWQPPTSEPRSENLFAARLSQGSLRPTAHRSGPY